jgi:REP element-mobilizing transposase RayT
MDDFYRRHLPHYQPEAAKYFTTFRLAGSLPKEVIERLQKEREESGQYLSGIDDDKKRIESFRQLRQEYFEKFDSLLDGSSTGPVWLKEESIASIVAEAIQFRNRKKYDLIAYCIMPNHVHLIFDLNERHERVGDSPYLVTNILRDLKKFAARESNRVLHRNGEFWQHESYDHVIRNGEELERMIWYVLYNPVKAGLVDLWEKWKWSYVKEGFV